MASQPDRFLATNLSSRPAHPATIATIDLSALAHNLAHVRRCLFPACEILAVVKADAYGHGAAAISRALVEAGITRLGVSTIDEGVALRNAGLRVPILLLGALLPDQLGEAIASDLTPIIHDPELAERLGNLPVSKPTPYPVHIKVDTGMGRLGLQPEQVVSLLQSPPFKGPLVAEGLMTHLADADNPDREFTEMQAARFRRLVDQIAVAGFSIPLVHAANSASILGHPSTHFTMVRPGIMLYGYASVPFGQTPPDLKPVLTLTTRVMQIRTLEPGESVSYNRSYIVTRPSRIAVLPIGYADGYSRALSNRGSVLLHGRRAPIRGRVCMDMTMVDVTDVPGVRPGDEAVLIGRQGSQTIWATDLAAWLDTIPYEVLCVLGPRVARVYR